MAGFQDLQDRVLWLSWGLKLDRITGLRDLQDRSLGAKLEANNGQDYRITRFTGLLQELSCPS